MRRQTLKYCLAAGLAVLAAGTAQALSQPYTSIPAALGASNSISPWTALVAYSAAVERPDRLCYWDFRNERWIPADRDDAVQLRSEDPKPIYREPSRGIGRCGQGVPAADIGAMGAIFGAFVYIATRDERESFSPD